MKKNVIKNIVSLYGFSIAKIILPLITLPYLTRILSINTYGVVSYVKTLMIYMQLAIDFGFMLSGTKDIVNAKDDIVKLKQETNNILLARLILAFLALGVLFVLIFSLPIITDYKAYTLLAFIPILLTVFSFDYVFRGLEKMEIITERYFLMKGLSTVFTFLLVKGDTDIIWIPILDIIGSAIALILVVFQLKKLGIRIEIKSMLIKRAIDKLKSSAVYFVSNMATSVYSALNTIIIGIFMNASDVAYWSLCIQMISTIQAMYSPIIDGIYPDMVKTKDINQIKSVLKIFMPIVLAGCLFTIIVAKYALFIIGGGKYIGATRILQLLVPILFFGFPAMVIGWPTLGVIDKQNKVTVTTVASAIFQLLGLLVLIFSGNFTLIFIAILRGTTEMVLFLSRLYFCLKYKSHFN